jgi:two-component system response regulator GlrR
MAGEFAIRVWSPGAVAPVSIAPIHDDPLALDRETLDVHDGSISRTANAPKLTPVGVTQLRLDVPAACARPVIAFEGIRFEALQHDIAPPAQTWKIAPGQLTRPARLARSPSVSVALVRQLDWERPGPTHHLIVLPPSRIIAPAQAVDLIAPALLLIGEAAIDITPADTLVPAAVPADAARPYSFRLRELEDALAHSATLHTYPNLKPLGPFRIPEFDTDLDAAALDAAAQTLLDRTLQPHLFFPVLEEDRRARLALAYQRPDRTAAVIISPAHPDAFTRDLTTWLTTESTRAPTQSTAPARRTSIPPAPTTTVTHFGAIATRNARFASVLDQLGRIAPTDLSLLFLGESGTGKEHLADAVHRASPRASRPFIALNCSAIADNLIESELFGHKRGAFTGAQTDRAGAFASADGGTLFLDEIGDAPLGVQLALLRALESKRIRAVGSDVDRAVDVRVFAATSRDLEELIERGSFRKDLYYRLAELTVELPPLRERREDIPALIAAILGTLSATTKVSKQAERLLVEREWPGNVRELRNALKRAVALSRGAEVLQAVHFSEIGGAEGDDDGGGDDDNAADVGDAGGTEMETETDGARGRELRDAAGGGTVRVEHARRGDVRLTFPVHVARRADEIWREGELREDPAASRYEQRAANRAALLCLAARAPIATWPKALSQQWHRLFGERWATAEDGRGLREVVRELGMNSRDETGRELVKRAASRAGRRR